MHCRLEEIILGMGRARVVVNHHGTIRSFYQLACFIRLSDDKTV